MPHSIPPLNACGPGFRSGLPTSPPRFAPSLAAHNSTIDRKACLRNEHCSDYGRCILFWQFHVLVLKRRDELNPIKRINTPKNSLWIWHRKPKRIREKEVAASDLAQR